MQGRRCQKVTFTARWSGILFNAFLNIHTSFDGFRVVIICQYFFLNKRYTKLKSILIFALYFRLLFMFRDLVNLILQSANWQLYHEDMHENAIESWTFRTIFFHNFWRRFAQQHCMDKLNSTLVNEASLRTSVIRWYGELNRGRFSLQDDFRDCRPNQSKISFCSEKQC